MKSAVSRPLIHCCKHCARIYGFACGYVDGCDHAVLGSYDLVLHLHSLKDHNNLASLNRLACAGLYAKDLSGMGAVISTLPFAPAELLREREPGLPPVRGPEQVRGRSRSLYRAAREQVPGLPDEREPEQAPPHGEPSLLL